MAVFKFVVSNPKTRKAYQIEVDQQKAVGLVGKKIGDKFNGDILGLPGYELEITGGTDKDGFPMHPNVHGPGRKKILLSGPPGFHPRLKGQRKRKMVRGNTISLDIVQINCKVVKEGSKTLEELLGKKEEKVEEEKEKVKEEGHSEEEKQKVEKVETREEESKIKEKGEETKVEEAKPEELAKNKPTEKEKS